jgi:NADH-quinone oxidoreductase subunit N
VSAVTPMAEKIQFLWPEITLFLTTCIVMVMGLSPNVTVRRLCGPLSALGLGVAGLLAFLTTPVDAASAGLLPNLVPFAKILVAVVGIVFLLLMSGTVDREEETAIARGRITFNPLRTNRAEFYAFFLFSLTGVMLCATATDLIWLFLALELTSLPTYIMVTISRTGRAGSRSQEAGVKYFFLGAFGAAIFLYGFALLYGGTGTTNLAQMRDIFLAEGINPIAMLGMLMALIGIGFKIAAVPMHLYTPDVYEGAAAQVSAFLAFVPKTAGFIAILLLVSAMGWHYHPDTSALTIGVDQVGGGDSLPGPVRLLLWVMAALTMTWGNVLALLQTNVKRMLAYSSIAHSGYILVGVIAGPVNPASMATNGIAAVLFYLLVYGVMNMGAFAVLACLERPARSRAPASGAALPPTSGEAAEPERPDEIENIEDLRGLCYSSPVLGWTMVICAASLLGLPPLLGFFGKVPLFTSGLAAGEYPLVIILGLNSAIAAFYYLRLVAMPLLEQPTAGSRGFAPTPFGTRLIAGAVSAGAVIVLSLLGGALMTASNHAAQVRPAAIAVPIRAEAPLGPPVPVTVIPAPPAPGAE